MSDKTCTELVVRAVGQLQRSPKGHPFVQCQVDGGTVAVWGSSGNMGHIELVSGAKCPFRMICDCIPSNWRQHDLWVYERHEIYSVEPFIQDPLPTTSPRQSESSVSLQELSGWRHQIVTWVATLEGARVGAPDGLAGRIGALSFSGAIPREVAALMKAVTEMRNAAEYESKTLSKVESLAVRNAWIAINEWAAKVGLPR